MFRTAKRFCSGAGQVYMLASIQAQWCKLSSSRTRLMLPGHRRHLSRWLGGSGMGFFGAVAFSAVNVLESPSWILIRPRRQPSLPSLAEPVPDIWSYSQAPDQVKETPVFVALAFTYAKRQCILRRSSYPVNEMSAGPSISKNLLDHVSVSIIRHHPASSGGIGL